MQSVERPQCRMFMPMIMPFQSLKNLRIEFEYCTFHNTLGKQKLRKYGGPESWAPQRKIWSHFDFWWIPTRFGLIRPAFSVLGWYFNNSAPMLTEFETSNVHCWTSPFHHLRTFSANFWLAKIGNIFITSTNFSMRWNTWTCWKNQPLSSIFKQSTTKQPNTDFTSSSQGHFSRSQWALGLCNTSR